MGDSKNIKKTLRTEEKIVQFYDSLNNKRAIDFAILLGKEPETEAEIKLEFLYNSVQASLRESVRRRMKNRGPALAFKLLTTGLSAVVTVLLGIKIPSHLTESLNNIALIISAFMTLILGLSSFMDNQALWILFTSVSEQYKVILKEIEYYTAGNKAIEIERVNEIKTRYEEILNQVANRITELRTEDAKQM